jgi:hypothetical protein
VPVPELAPPGGVQLGLGRVRRDAEHEIVVGQGTAVVGRGGTSFVSHRELGFGSAVSHGGWGLWQAPRRGENGYANSRFRDAMRSTLR